MVSAPRKRWPPPTIRQHQHLAEPPWSSFRSQHCFTVAGFTALHSESALASYSGHHPSEAVCGPTLLTKEPRKAWGRLKYSKGRAGQSTNPEKESEWSRSTTSLLTS